MPFQQGQIVWVEIPDPSQGNVKLRPALILTRTEQIQSGGPVVVAGLSTSIQNPLPSGHFLLPWALSGRVKTGLSKRSVVKSDWLKHVNVKEIQRVSGMAPGQVVKDVLNWLHDHGIST